MKIQKIVFVLRYYDKNKYTEYCCQTHASSFALEEGDCMKVMENPMYNTIEYLISKPKFS